MFKKMFILPVLIFALQNQALAYDEPNDKILNVLFLGVLICK